MRALLIFVLLCFNHTTSFADELADKVPLVIRPFAEAGTIIYDWKSADLNGDGLDDYLVVLEVQKINPDDPDIVEKQRPVLIIVRQKDNSLKLAKRNDIAVSCSTCGGRLFVDGFLEISAATRSFSITNQNSGTAYQSTSNYKFGYSRRDNTWQLVRVDDTQVRNSGGNRIANIATPPRDFGKIDFSAFDPAFYIEQGEGYKFKKK